MRLSGLLEPISPDHPAGPSLRSDLLYREIELAREEEPDGPQREWQRERRTADHARVVALATDVLAHRSKDLQVAAWLAEAWAYREGLPGLASGVELVRALAERFWDDVHPEMEDGDPDLRAGPMEWLDRVLPVAVRAVPLTRAGHGTQAYDESRALGYEKAAQGDDKKHRAWIEAVEAGKVSADAFDRALADTPARLLAERRAEAKAARAAVEALEELCALRFERDPPRFPGLRESLRQIEELAGRFLDRQQAGSQSAAAPPSAGASDPPRSPAPNDPNPAKPPIGSARPADPIADAAGSAPSNSRAADPIALLDPEDSMMEEATGDAADADDGADPNDGAGPPRSREEAAARMAALARWLRARDPADPAPYLMVRGYRWGELRAGGPVPDPRLLAAPPTARRVRLKTLALAERWADLLEAAEEVMASEHGRGWLDLQRYVATACAALGAEYDAVRHACAGALGELLRDLPALPGLTLMDDTPAANPGTLAWLRESGIVPAADGAPSPAPPAGTAEERAGARAAAGEPERAVEILLDAASRERSPRARFLLRARAAEVMVDAGLAAVAAPILRELVEQVQRHALEEWEAGEVVAHPLALLCRCMDRLGDAPGERAPLYLRVCRLDPLRAIGLGGGADAAA